MNRSLLIALLLMTSSGGALAMPADAAPPRVEIVAVREGSDLLLYVDDYASNAPVAGLQVDLQAGGRSLRAAATADGRYRLPADLVDEAATSSTRVTLSGKGIELSMPIEIPPATASAPVVSPTIVDTLRRRLPPTALLALAIAALVTALAIRHCRRRPLASQRL